MIIAVFEWPFSYTGELYALLFPKLLHPLNTTVVTCQTYLIVLIAFERSVIVVLMMVVRNQWNRSTKRTPANRKSTTTNHRPHHPLGVAEVQRDARQVDGLHRSDLLLPGRCHLPDRLQSGWDWWRCISASKLIPGEEREILLALKLNLGYLQVGISYIFFVMALWTTVISELFASKICLPHF